MHKEQIITGWLEWCSLPQLKIKALQVKLDTGAYSSSLHATNIKQYIKDDVEMVSFSTYSGHRKIKCITPLYNKKLVRTSNKEQEVRLFIRTKIKIGTMEKTIRVNLTNRNKLRNNMLLGRNAMRNLLVDPRERFVHGKPS
jgi:hypothetical protein